MMNMKNHIIPGLFSVLLIVVISCKTETEKVN